MNHKANAADGAVAHALAVVDDIITLLANATRTIETEFGVALAVVRQAHQVRVVRAGVDNWNSRCSRSRGRGRGRGRGCSRILQRRKSSRRSERSGKSHEGHQETKIHVVRGQR